MPKFALLVDYVAPYILWDYCKTDDDLKVITDHCLGNPDEGHVWDAYYPEQYKDVWVVDAQEILIIRDTFAECVVTMYNAVEDQILTYYIDGLLGEEMDPEIRSQSFEDYYGPLLSRLREEVDIIVDHPTLRHYVDSH